WETLAVGFKPYSTNGSCHPTIDALLQLRQTEGLRAADVAKLDVFCSSATKEHVGWAYRPGSVTTAQMNLPYIAAVVLTDGEAFTDQFTQQRIGDPALLELAGRVHVHADPEIDARGDTARHATRLEVTRTDGTALRDSREYARGSARRPLRADEVIDKYRKSARHGLTEPAALRLEQMVQQLDQVADITELAEALRGPVAHNGPPPEAGTATAAERGRAPTQSHAHEGIKP
ncbi:MAG: hypothetical protein ACRDT8_25560, partial [Micromonosporaceae bacterium]